MIQVETSIGSFSYHDSIDNITLSDKIDFAEHTNSFREAIVEHDEAAVDHLIKAVKVFIPGLPEGLDISDESDDQPLIASDTISVIGLHNHYNYLIQQYYLDIIASILESINLEELEPQ